MIGQLRRLAQTVRHAPGIRHADPLWNLLRRPYRQVLRMAGARGVPVQIGGRTVRLHPELVSLAWEKNELDAYRHFLSCLRTGDVVFDIGAHIGTYTLLASQIVGATGRVLAFEPDSDTRAYLAEHLAWNGYADRVRVRDVCCAARVGEMDFFRIPGEASGQSGFVHVAGHEKTRVRTTTLDEEVKQSGLVPNLIKIDVEGGEWEVLAGAVETLRAHHPVLFLSLHPTILQRLGLSEHGILTWLAEQGYTNTVIARDHEVHVVSRKAA